ncbi:alpha-D-ribose 1-methylphosphonate 5-triphosphate diphosphatase [Rubneribacter badeniensis]|uniref:Alpha-D-ribose 1-methylphosphonate 5-triphosphate diphosphatase n=1 Tax=Rubneribacter badeniensis TaxID=2070688 RepID=A0A2K2U4H5_9ACTN|nr:alpha-D-ribose 1-methylphosphonate 5-triphosphate diphosphatase [Rubneribacter badeniensis]PNV65243.1 alpha-D-ribose 1-methylphosphonate 5-triphosphate diphosphatase [Rubneribacter badeniensis]
MNANSCIIRGGSVVCADRVLPDHDVVIVDGRIAAIEPVGAHDFDVQSDAALGALPVVDARGAYVTPGLIDVHSDYVENVASPRPSVVMDLNTSLYKADRELVSHGITTIFHSLSVYGAHIFDHKPIRNFGNVSALIDRVAAMRGGEERDHLIRHRLHMRVELDSVDLYDDIERYLRSGKVDLVSFMDHTPGQGQYRDLLLFGETLKGYRDVTDEEVREIIQQQQESEKLSYAQIAKLADIARGRGISIASHDDDSAEKLAFMDGLQATISEFPISLDIAREARARGMHTVAGAPNVMLGHSHSGNLSAREAVTAGAIDVLCSDYYPAALLDAVFALRDACGLDIAQAFALVTINPAKAAGIADEVGSLAVGKRADVLLVREISCGAAGATAGADVVGAVRSGARGAVDADACAGAAANAQGAHTMPTVTRAFVGGHSVFRSHYPDQPLGYGRDADEARAFGAAGAGGTVGAGGTGVAGVGVAGAGAASGMDVALVGNAAVASASFPSVAEVR